MVKKIYPKLSSFIYQYGIHIQTMLDEKTMPKNGWSPISLQNVKNYSKVLSFFVSVSFEFYAIAVHYMHENLGILFCPQLGMLGKDFKNLQGKKFKFTAKEYLDENTQKYNSPMIGLVKINDTELEMTDTRDCDENGNVIPIIFKYKNQE